MSKPSMKKSGRPLLESGKRTRVIKAKLTDEEFSVLTGMESALGINRSELIKARVLQGSNSVLVDGRRLLDQLDALGAELGRAGNNINQLARHANVLNKRGMLDGEVIIAFTPLFKDYIANQRELEKVIRQLVRLMRP